MCVCDGSDGETDGASWLFLEDDFFSDFDLEADLEAALDAVLEADFAAGSMLFLLCFIFFAGGSPASPFAGASSPSLLSFASFRSRARFLFLSFTTSFFFF